MTTIKEGAHFVEAALKLFPEVTWDRFAGDPESEIGVGVFGWIAKPNGRSDFVYLRMDRESGPWLIATSSAKYSAEFSKRLGFKGHSDCKRVSEHFPNVRAI
jgi:hypothetical protein